MPQTASVDARHELWLGTQIPQDPDWDYGQWLEEILKDRFESIEKILGAEETAGLFMELLKDLIDHRDDSPSTWREALGNVPHAAWTVMHLPNRIDELGLYGLFGAIWPSTYIPIAERTDCIEGMLKEVEAFVATSDLGRIAGKSNQITKIANLARARWNIDRQQGDVDPTSLAVLGGVSEGRIRNLMSGQDRVLENAGERSGRITATSALTWLQTRPDFYPSIWDQDETEEDVPSDTGVSSFSEVLFVPVAQDGSIFHPGLARDGRFQIGPKGSEFHCDSFDEALKALQHMPDAYWRRPNPSGHWSIVKGSQWARIERVALLRGAITA